MTAPETVEHCASCCACSTGHGARSRGRWWSRFRKTFSTPFPSVRPIAWHCIACSANAWTSRWPGPGSATERHCNCSRTCTARRTRSGNAGARCRCTGGLMEFAERSTSEPGARPEGRMNCGCRRSSNRRFAFWIRIPGSPLSTTRFPRWIAMVFFGSCWRTRVRGVSPNRVVQSVRPSDGQVLLPQDHELRDLLRRSRWLPRRAGGALAPDAVLIAPKELLDAVAGLAAAGAFGEKRLPEAVDPGTWEDGGAGGSRDSSGA